MCMVGSSINVVTLDMNGRSYEFDISELSTGVTYYGLLHVPIVVSKTTRNVYVSVNQTGAEAAATIKITPIISAQ